MNLNYEIMDNSQSSQDVGIRFNEQQNLAIHKIKTFLECPDHDVFILIGSAGTGKTTLIKQVVESLEGKNMAYKLLAPTNQATKVLAVNTGKTAKTLHSFLYRIIETELETGSRIEFVKRDVDFSTPQIYIIDEASMVSSLPSDSELFVSKNSPLFDLMDFLKKSPEGSKAIFIGDINQLPPVHESDSPALSAQFLSANYKVDVSSFELTEVMRQKEGGYLLRNAMILRDVIQQNYSVVPYLKFKNLYNPTLAINQFVKNLDNENLYDKIFIAWKNVTVKNLNEQVRKNIFKEANYPLCKGDRIIVVQNYYYKNAIITKGEIGRVKQFFIESVRQVAGINFADADLEFYLSNGTAICIRVKINVDFLTLSPAAYTQEKHKNLWVERKKANKVFRETDNPTDDVYLSAIMLNYGYAITAHKAQGSEWSEVFLHPEYPADSNRMKWLYTAITRAKDELFSY